MVDVKLTHKQRVFVKSIVEGKSKKRAYIDAYNTNGHNPTVYAEASRTARLPQVRQAIDQALAAHELTPEYAIANLKHIAEQDKDLGAKRQACLDILELHGITRHRLKR